MHIGYARISTPDQNTALQHDALQAAGCEKIYSDTCSGATPTAQRPGLQQALAYARPADTLVVWRLDRLGRNLKDLVQQVTGLQARGVHFVSLQERLDTTSAAGKLIFHLFASLAEFERDLIRERVQAGLQAARARGRKGGRPQVLVGAKLERAAELMAAGQLPVREIARIVGVDRSTLYRHLNPDGTRREVQVRTPARQEAAAPRPPG